MQARQVFDSEARGAALLKRCGYAVGVVALLLGVAHLLSPEYRWGQGRQSYFNLDNSLTLASWLASVQLVGIAILALVSFHRDRQHRHAALGRTDWGWLVGALFAGDASYLYDNNQRHIPIARAVDSQANLSTIRDMHRRAASPFFILPGHDPLVLQRFPQVSAGIVHITAVPHEE